MFLKACNIIPWYVHDPILLWNDYILLSISLVSCVLNCFDYYPDLCILLFLSLLKFLLVSEVRWEEMNKVNERKSMWEWGIFGQIRQVGNLLLLISFSEPKCCKICTLQFFLSPRSVLKTAIPKFWVFKSNPKTYKIVPKATFCHSLAFIKWLMMKVFYLLFRNKLYLHFPSQSVANFTGYVCVAADMLMTSHVKLPLLSKMAGRGTSFRFHLAQFQPIYREKFG